MKIPYLSIATLLLTAASGYRAIRHHSADRDSRWADAPPQVLASPFRESIPSSLTPGVAADHRASAASSTNAFVTRPVQEQSQVSKERLCQLLRDSPPVSSPVEECSNFDAFRYLKSLTREK